jgi:hypothetical protein
MTELNISKQTIADEIVGLLRALELKADVNVDRAGQRLDVLAWTHRQLSVALAIRTWPSVDDVLLAKAKAEADLLLQSSKASAAWVVIPSLPDAWQSDSVLNLHGLTLRAKALLNCSPDFGLQGAAQLKETIAAESKRSRLFVAMPFAERFDDTYYLGIVPAADVANLSCVREDQVILKQIVVEAIHQDIRDSEYFLADLTEGNANVAYELGYAKALNKPTILVSATPPERLPFDMRPWSIHIYTHGQVWKLKKHLETAFAALLKTQGEKPPIA